LTTIFTNTTSREPSVPNNVMAAAFTEREHKLMAMAWQCFVEQPKIDFVKLAGLVGMVRLRLNYKIYFVIDPDANRPTKDLLVMPGHRSGKSLLRTKIEMSSRM
jgi:hypothetical protein